LDKHDHTDLPVDAKVESDSGSDKMEVKSNLIKILPLIDSLIHDERDSIADSRELQVQFLLFSQFTSYLFINKLLFSIFIKHHARCLFNS
jgi:hypothetical protein